MICTSLCLETPSSPRRCFNVIQGQLKMRSRVRFSAGFKIEGSRCSASSASGVAGAISWGRVAREGSGSVGRATPMSMRERT